MIQIKPPPDFSKYCIKLGKSSIMTTLEHINRLYHLIITADMTMHIFFLKL